MDYAAVSQSCKRFEEELKKHKKTRGMIQDLENEILA